MENTPSLFKCVIAEDNMSATLTLDPPCEGTTYVVDDVLVRIHSNGINGGIIHSEVERMVKDQIYNEAVVIARGREPVDGVDGYYDFYFDVGGKKSPTIRPDGSVDYQSMNIVQSVQKGDILAMYHSSVPGVHGYDVKGRELRCKPGKEQKPLTGDGFELCDDGVTYRAVTEGRVEYNDSKLYIRDIYEIRGDLDLLTGRVDFRGDVVIHGNVRSGTFIRASKSITIEGNVEAATLIAEGDIVLKKGMQGGSKAKIVCGGDLYAYFLEYTDVAVKGSIEANIILNCKVSAGKDINVKGKKGLVVGGRYEAAKSLNSTNLGNPAEVRTICNIGLKEETVQKNHKLMTKYEETQKELKSLRQSLEAKAEPGFDYEPIKKRIKRNELLCEELSREIEEIRQIMEYSQRATVTASGNVYPGVIIRIDEREMAIERNSTSVKFVRSGSRDEIEMLSLM